MDTLARDSFIMERLVIVLYESVFVSMCGCERLFRHKTQEILLNGFSKIMLQKA